MTDLVLVEDDDADAELVRIAAQETGLPVTMRHFRDGQEALDGLIGAKLRPPLILLDLKLPKLDGKEVLQRIRRESSTALVPVVVMSSSDRPDDIFDCYKLGANSYVQKPLGFDEHSRVVSLILRFWLTANRC